MPWREKEMSSVQTRPSGHHVEIRVDEADGRSSYGLSGRAISQQNGRDGADTYSTLLGQIVDERANHGDWNHTMRACGEWLLSETNGDYSFSFVTDRGDAFVGWGGLATPPRLVFGADYLWDVALQPDELNEIAPQKLLQRKLFPGELVHLGVDGRPTSYFVGDPRLYPTNLHRELPCRERPSDKPRVAIAISGKGTNMLSLVRAAQSGRLDAEIAGVISNNPAAEGLQQQLISHLPQVVVSSHRRLKDLGQRRQFCEEFAEAVIGMKNVDILALAGFMVLLDKESLQRIYDAGITVLNIHPALLTAGNDDEFQTLDGKTIPVLRGAHAVHDAYEHQLPVTGVTVHQVLPDQKEMDTGPILMQGEVYRQKGDSEEDLAHRVHRMEHALYQGALARAIHYRQHGIDTRQGNLVW